MQNPRANEPNTEYNSQTSLAFRRRPHNDHESPCGPVAGGLNHKLIVPRLQPFKREPAIRAGHYGYTLRVTFRNRDARIRNRFTKCVDHNSANVPNWFE